MEKPRRVVFSFGLSVGTAIRALEVYRPERERIYDASFDHALLPAFWRWLMLPGVRHGLLAVLEKTELGTPGMLYIIAAEMLRELPSWLSGMKTPSVTNSLSPASIWLP